MSSPEYSFEDLASGVAEAAANDQEETTLTSGTSVLGIQFDCGVMIAADNLVSHRSFARYQNTERVFKVADTVIIGAGGDIGDFQWLQQRIDDKVIEDMCYENTFDVKPKSLFTWISRFLYVKRTRDDALDVDIVLGGMEGDTPYLARIDLNGIAFEDRIVATGIGTKMALPLMRELIKSPEKLTQAQAFQVLRKCMEILFYRDCRATFKYSVAVCTAEGSFVKGPFKVDQNWEMAAKVMGY